MLGELIARGITGGGNLLLDASCGAIGSPCDREGGSRLVQTASGFIGLGKLKNLVTGAKNVGVGAWNLGRSIGKKITGRGGGDIVGSAHKALRPTQDWINPAQVQRYATALREGRDVAPITVQRFPDGRRYILDGHHRYVASQRTGIPVRVNYIDGPGPVGLPDWSGVTLRAPGPG